jgi:hypothetical protein
LAVTACETRGNTFDPWAVLAELRAFEYGLAGSSGRPKMGARPGRMMIL